MESESESVEDSSVPVKAGDVLAGKYRVESVLGVGGMGVVVAATHIDLGELRAVKFMLREAAENEQGVERFLREARAAVKLKSAHVVRIHDVGRFESGEPYMVMEYLKGCDLKALLVGDGPQPVAQAVRFTLQALEALAEAHAAGIVHRDLKPANLFVTHDQDGERSVKVLDFGISKITDPSGEGMEMTKTNTLMGSPYYMSPEQMRSTRDVDARADIWSLGVILYEMLAGVVPFKGDTITAQCAMVIQEEPPPPSLHLGSSLPDELERIVLRCLEKDRNQRYPSVREFAEDLVNAFSSPQAVRSVERIRRALPESEQPPGSQRESQPGSLPEPPIERDAVRPSHVAAGREAATRISAAQAVAAAAPQSVDEGQTLMMTGGARPAAPSQELSQSTKSSWEGVEAVPERRSRAGIVVAIGAVAVAAAVAGVMLTRGAGPANPETPAAAVAGDKVDDGDATQGSASAAAPSGADGSGDERAAGSAAAASTVQPTAQPSASNTAAPVAAPPKSPWAGPSPAKRSGAPKAPSKAPPKAPTPSDDPFGMSRK